MSNYIVNTNDGLSHSAKGTTWSNHKYVAIKNGRYIYPDGLQETADRIASNAAINRATGVKSSQFGDTPLSKVKAKTATKTATGSKVVSSTSTSTLSGSTSSSSKSGSSKKSSSSSKKSSGSKAKSASGKSKSSSSKSKSTDNTEKTTKSSSGSSKSTSTKEKTSSSSSEKKVTANTKPNVVDSDTAIKTAISSVATLGENDSYYATQNDSGGYTITIEYEDGSTQSITCDNMGNVIHNGEKETMEHSLYSSDYLVHHGILGMKWGVRRYQNKDGSLTSVGRRRYGYVEKQEEKSKTAITSLGRQYHAINAKVAKSEIERSDKVRSAKGLYKKYHERFGYGSEATLHKGKAEGYAEANKIAKTGFGKAYTDAKSNNNKYISEYYDKRNTESLGRKFVNNLFLDTTYLKTPYQRLSGRTTTIGKEIVGNILTGGTVGLVKDAAYLGKKSRDAKKEYKEEKKQVLTKLNNTLSDLEKNGKGNDVSSVTKAASEYDNDLKSAKSTYKANKTKSSVKSDSYAVKLEEGHNKLAKEYNATTGFANFVKKEAGGFNQIDDPELLSLLEMEYEETGKKAYK